MRVTVQPYIEGGLRMARAELRKRGIFVIHLYQNNGYNIVLDVNSGAVHVVDKAAYDVIGALESQN